MANYEPFIYKTADYGRTWARITTGIPGGIPGNPIYVIKEDLEIHPRDGDLVAGTHGRGLWILDDITPLRQLTPEVLRADARLLENRVATQWLSIQPQHSGGALAFQGRNPTRNAVIAYYLSSRIAGNLEFAVTSPDGTSACRATASAEAGLGRVEWTMRWSEGPGIGAAAAGRGRDLPRHHVGQRSDLHGHHHDSQGSDA